jgi:poly(3-hydroxyalkanoate) synthetase
MNSQTGLSSSSELLLNLDQLVAAFCSKMLADINTLQQQPELQTYNSPSAKIIANQHLYHFPNSGAKVALIVPSLINSCKILDLTQAQSFARRLSEKYDCYLLDWHQNLIENSQSLSYYVQTLSQVILALGDQALYIGHCFGGIILVYAAIALKLREITVISTPFNFKTTDFSPISEAAKLSLEQTSPEDLGQLINAIYNIRHYFSGLMNIEQALNDDLKRQIYAWTNQPKAISATALNDINTLICTNKLDTDLNNSDLQVKAIIGTKDKVCSLPSTLHVKNIFKNHQLFEYPTGHLGLILKDYALKVLL